MGLFFLLTGTIFNYVYAGGTFSGESEQKERYRDGFISARGEVLGFWGPPFFDPRQDPFFGHFGQNRPKMTIFCPFFGVSGASQKIWKIQGRDLKFSFQSPYRSD